MSSISVRSNVLFWWRNRGTRTAGAVETGHNKDRKSKIEVEYGGGAAKGTAYRSTGIEILSTEFAAAVCVFNRYGVRGSITA